MLTREGTHRFFNDVGERGEVVCGILEFGRGGVDFILFIQDANNPVIGNLFPLLGELPLGKFYMFKFGFWVTCPTSCNVESQLYAFQEAAKSPSVPAPRRIRKRGDCQVVTLEWCA